MGRPLRKDINGVDVLNTYAAANTGIRVEFHDGTSLRTDGILIKQRGAKTFVCARIGTPTVLTTCVVQSTAPSAVGQMNLFGYVGGNGGSKVNLAKITKRVATDFSNNRYTWYLQNDSSNDYIVLTAI